jgi:hypothetical protein
LLSSEIERQQAEGKQVAFQVDAAFAKPEIYEAMEERGVMYAIRIPVNDSLERDIAELLTRPVGRATSQWFGTWAFSTKRPGGRRSYNKRGTAVQWIKEGKQATHWTQLSCHRFRANEARLQLSLLAYDLGNLWRRLVLPKRIDTCSLTSLQQRLVSTGGRLVKHAQYYWLLLAESQLKRRLFGSNAAQDRGAPDGGNRRGLQTGKERAFGRPKPRWGLLWS